MKFKVIYKIFTYAIMIIAYAVIIYKLATYDNYTGLFEQFTTNISTNWLFLLACLILMPCNILAESLKWRCAISHIEKISIKEAISATLRGQVGGIATPNKLGDIPTRALSLHEGNKTSGIIMGFIASWALLFIIITIGAITTYIYFDPYPIACVLIILLILSPLLLKFIPTDKVKSNTLKTLLLTPFSKILSLIGLSLVRYLVFCSQLFLMYLFFNINITIAQAIMVIPTIYLFSTITPTLITSEAPTRSTYAIFLLAPICQNTEPTIALATSLLWALNCGVPIIVGSFLFKKSA